MDSVATGSNGESISNTSKVVVFPIVHAWNPCRDRLLKFTRESFMLRFLLLLEVLIGHWQAQCLLFTYSDIV